MAYRLSATKLQAYQSCPQSYYWRYELKIKDTAVFAKAALGTALHQALAQSYRDWHYMDALPPLSWVHDCWEQQCQNLKPSQADEGKDILTAYYSKFIEPLPVLRRPLAVEGRLQGTLRVANLEFTIHGRYDRLDYLEDGLELIDYKSNRDGKLPDPQVIHLQIGLYFLALEQTYQQSLQRMSLLYLRTGEQVGFEATTEYKQRVRATIGQLALHLRTDREWTPTPGEHCQQCNYAKYCAAIQVDPEPLPEVGKPQHMQLVLSL